MAKNDERNRRRREQYKKGKEAGLNRGQMRSVKKSAKDDPSILDAITGIFTRAVKDVSQLLENTADAITDEPKKQSKSSSKKSSKPKSKPKPKKGWNGDKRRNVPSFSDFTKTMPGAKANDIIREYRKRGGTIGNEKGKRIIREETGREYQPEKKTRIKYYGNERNPTKKKYIKDRYMYIVKYKVYREGYVEPEIMYATIAANRRYTVGEVKDATAMMIEDMRDGGKEVYAMIDYDEDSIEVLYAVDTHM